MVPRWFQFRKFPRDLVVLCSLVWICSAGPASRGQSTDEADPDEIVHPVETAPLTFKLIDEDGEPVAGVDVMPSGLRCEEDPGSWYGWPTRNVGRGRVLKSDENGEITVQYPIRFGQPPNLKTTTVVDFRFIHPEYVYGSSEVRVELGSSEFVLSRGCPVLFTAQDHEDQPVEEFAVSMAGNGGLAGWQMKGGEVKSHGVPDGSWQTMLVAPRDDGRHLFSGILPARYMKGKGVTIRDVRLQPGLELRGQLSSKVPRPVTHGKVIAHCLPKPADATHGRKNPSLAWTEWVEIQEDGSFVFPSLPRTGMIQLIALCRGWVVENGPRDDGPRAFTAGVLLDLKEFEYEDNVLSGVEIPMTEAGSLKVKVVKPDGMPLVGANVSTWPNQSYEKGGSTILGSAYRSVEALQHRIEGNSSPFRSWFADMQETRYTQTTDEAGFVHLHDIPLGEEEGLWVGSKTYQAAETAASGNEIRYVLESTEPKEIEVNVVPIEGD